MNLNRARPITNTSSEGLTEIIVDSIQDIKGKNIVKLDLSLLDHAPTNCFIICQGESNTQIRGIAHNIYKRVKEELGITPNHTEGISDSNWVLVDYFDTVVHIFYPETRAFYNLENLWSDAQILTIEDL